MQKKNQFYFSFITQQKGDLQLGKGRPPPKKTASKTEQPSAHPNGINFFDSKKQQVMQKTCCKKSSIVFEKWGNFSDAYKKIKNLRPYSDASTASAPPPAISGCTSAGDCDRSPEPEPVQRFPPGSSPDMLHHRQIVGDRQIGQPQFLLKIGYILKKR